MPAIDQGTIGLGPQRETRLRRLGNPIEDVGPSVSAACHARAQEFDLQAGLVVPAGQRDRLERVCAYTLRPPVASDRLHLTPDGQVQLALRQPWRDGTTAVVFDPGRVPGRLAVLVPRPRINLLLYYGVPGARAAWRPEVVPRPARAAHPEAEAPTPAQEASGHPPARPRRYDGRQPWATLMQGTLGLDVLACPRCGGRLRLIALLAEAAVVRRVLGHLDLPTDIPPPRPARPPPAAQQPGVVAWDDGLPVFVPRG